MRAHRPVSLGTPLLLAALVVGCGDSSEAELTAEITKVMGRIKDEASSIPMALAFSPDGRSLFVGTGLWNAKVRSWDMASGKLLHELEVEDAPDTAGLDNASFVSSIAPAADNSAIAFGGRFTKRTSLATWDRVSGAIVEISSVPAPRSVAAGLQPGEFICGMADGEVTSLDAATGRATPIAKMRGEVGWLFSVPAARWLFMLTEHYEVAAWDVSSGDRIGTLQLDDSLTAIDVTRDGRRVALADRNGELIVYEFYGGEFRLESRRELGDPLAAIAWSHDAASLAACIQEAPEPGAPGSVFDEAIGRYKAGKRTLRVWDVNTWAERPTGLAAEDIVFAAFSPVALVLAVVDRSGRPHHRRCAERRDSALRPSAPGGWI
jgi:WD40 repeat protein